MIIFGRKCCSGRETGLLSALSDDHGLTITSKPPPPGQPGQLPEEIQPAFDIKI
jgi:hypothetical protein